jgi:hypothetical protein
MLLFGCSLVGGEHLVMSFPLAGCTKAALNNEHTKETKESKEGNS